jgi:uncharacterized protein YfaP (DUF2135 family)
MGTQGASMRTVTCDGEHLWYTMRILSVAGTSDIGSPRAEEG